MKIKLPSKTFIRQDLEIESELSLVFIGANGSGKSRLGSWIEDNNQNVHRISAQKILSIPEDAPPRNIGEAQRYVTYGHPTAGQQRWNQGKTTSLLNDFTHVLSLLFAHENKRNAEYFIKSKSDRNTPHTKSRIDLLAEIWQTIQKKKHSTK